MTIKDTVHVYRLVGGDRLAWHGRYHAHNPGEYEFHCFLEGQGALLLNRTRHRIDGNGLFLARPLDFHSILPGSLEGPISYYAILFELDLTKEDDRMASALMERHSPAPARAIEPRDRFLLEELHRLYHEASADKPKGEPPGHSRAAAYLLLSLIERWYGSADRSGATASLASGAWMHVNRALSIMQRSLRDKLDMGELASRLGLSEEHFIRLFKSAIGMSPFQYFTRLKIEAASSVLVESPSSVGAVAERFGFENPFHFSRVFSKCTGLSPTAYRKTFRAGAIFQEKKGDEL